MVALHTNRLSSLCGLALQPSGGSVLIALRSDCSLSTAAVCWCAAPAITPAVQKARTVVKHSRLKRRDDVAKGSLRESMRVERVFSIKIARRARQTANARRGVRRCGDRGTCRAYRVERTYRVGGHENLTRTSRQKKLPPSSCEVHNESRRVTMSSAAFYESLYPATTAYLREAAPETYRATLAPPNAVESNLRMAGVFVRPPSSPPVYPARSSASLSARVSSPAPGAKHAETSPGVSPSSGLAWPALSPPPRRAGATRRGP